MHPTAEHLLEGLLASKRFNGGGALFLALALGCSSTEKPAGVLTPAMGGSAPAAAASGSPSGGGGSGAITIDVGPEGGSQGSGKCAATNPSADNDGDGFTVQAGDCSDCDPAVNPGAYDFAGNGVDEDCSGKPDDEPAGCDEGPAAADGDAMAAAFALGLCRKQAGSSWGVVAARWVFPNGEATSRATADNLEEVGESCVREGAPTNADSHGILPNFGTNVLPREGKTLVALSSGVARPGINVPEDPGLGESPFGGWMCTESLAPPGFPKDSVACPDVVTAPDTQARDAIALELEIKTPTNARALSFDFDFYTYEWPEYVCSTYNDFFVALLKSSHPATPADENITFDGHGNPVSVNNGFVEVCDAAIGKLRPGGKSFECARGTSELVGTGFDTEDDVLLSGDQEQVVETPSSHAATGWLNTMAPVTPGETIRLRFAIWDMFDESLDSTVLLDHFTWTLVEPTTPTTERVPEVR
jgi:hypothetical protein